MTPLRFEALEERRLLSVIVSDSFNRPNAAPSNLGAADLAYGGSGTYYYSPLFPTTGNPANPVGANITDNALQNYSNGYGGVELTAYADAATNFAHLGEDLGQDLDLQADLVVPTNSSADVSEAGLFFRSQANAAGDNLFSGTNAGFWVKVQSTGQVEVERLDTGAIIAYSGAPVSFDTSAAHDLQVAVQGTQLQVAIDGNLLELSENGLVSTTVSLPATSGSDNGAAGVLFGDEPNPGQISGQRANNLVISTYTSISGLPVQDNFQDRFKPDQSQATAANVGVGPGVHLANLSIQSVSDQDWYKFQLLRPDSIDVNLGFVPADGELALQVYDAAGTLLATGSPTAGGSVAAFSSTLPAGTYYIQVSGVGGATNTYSLSIAPDAASTTTVYYVNDGSTVDDYYTTAPGNDANAGLTPATPKASVQSVLDTYTLGPTSLVVIDTGTYTTPVTITGTEQGAAYAGSPGGSNFTYSGNRFELDDSDSNEFYALNLTGSGGIGFYVQPGTVANSRRNTLLDNTFNGPDIAIEINGGDSDVIQNNVISAAVPTGSICRRWFRPRSAATRSPDAGPRLPPLEEQGATWSSTAMRSPPRTSASTSATGWGGPCWGPSRTTRSPPTTCRAATAFMFPPRSVTIFGNDVSGNYVGISSNGGAAVVYGNTIDGNVTGLQGSGTFGGTSWAAGQPNDVYDNTTGIQSYPYGGTTRPVQRGPRQRRGRPGHRLERHHPAQPDLPQHGPGDPDRRRQQRRRDEQHDLHALRRRRAHRECLQQRQPAQQHLMDQ